MLHEPPLDLLTRLTLELRYDAAATRFTLAARAVVEELRYNPKLASAATRAGWTLGGWRQCAVAGFRYAIRNISNTTGGPENTRLQLRMPRFER